MKQNGAIRKPGSSIVTIEDSFVIRQVIKSVLGNESIIKEQTTIHSSANGLEGLGLIIITNPDIIILDATLPRYSGRELVEFLASNPRYQGTFQRIIVTHMGNITTQLPPKYILIDKREKNYIDILISSIQDKFNSEITFDKPSTKLGRFFGERAISAECKTEVLALKAAAARFGIKRMFISGLGSLSHIMSKIYLLFVYLFLGRGLDSNLPQERKDFAKYRTQYASAISTFIVTSFFFFMQLLLVLTPGIYLYGYKIKSLATIGQNMRYQNVSFGDAVYEDGVELVDNTYLLESTTEYTIEDSKQAEYEEESKLKGSDRYISIIDVKGYTTEDPKVRERVSHNSSSPKIVFNQPVEYSDLISLREYSSFNSFETSVSDTNGIWTSSQITYQLSPDGITWYYYNVNNHRWESVVSGYLNSNVVQEVNKYIDLYEDQVGGEYLYIIAYLNSDGNTPLELYSLRVEREVDLVTKIKGERDPYTSKPSLDLNFVSEFDEEVELILTSGLYEEGYVNIEGEINEKATEYTGELYVYFYYFNEKTGTNGSPLGRVKVDAEEREFSYRGISLPEGTVNAEILVIEDLNAKRIGYSKELLRIKGE